MPPADIINTLALKFATSSINCVGLSAASVSRRLVCSQRMGSTIHQPGSAGVPWSANKAGGGTVAAAAVSAAFCRNTLRFISGPSSHPGVSSWSPPQMAPDLIYIDEWSVSPREIPVFSEILNVPSSPLTQGIRRLHHRLWRWRRDRRQGADRGWFECGHAGGGTAAESPQRLQRACVAVRAAPSWSGHRRTGSPRVERRIPGAQWFLGDRWRALHYGCGIAVPLVPLAHRGRPDQSLRAHHTAGLGGRLQGALQGWPGRRLADFV